MPGLIAYIAMLTAVVSTALSVVREKEAGTMEQIRMSPIGPAGLRAGQDGAVLRHLARLGDGRRGVSMALFDLPMRGSWLLLVGSVSLFLVGALAFGLLISTIAETQQVAFQMALLSSFLPTLMLSGFIFPISSMPAFLQAVTHVVPARYFLIVLRGVAAQGRRRRGVLARPGGAGGVRGVLLALASVRLKRQWA